MFAKSSHKPYIFGTDEFLYTFGPEIFGLIERKVYILGRSNISIDLYRDIVDSLANILNSEVIPRLTEIFSPTIVKSIEVYPYTNK